MKTSHKFQPDQNLSRTVAPGGNSALYPMISQQGTTNCKIQSMWRNKGQLKIKITGKSQHVEHEGDVEVKLTTQKVGTKNN